jgi:hypothetical protein
VVALRWHDRDPFAAEFCAKRVGLPLITKTESHIASRHRLSASIRSRAIHKPAADAPSVHRHRALTEARAWNRNCDLVRVIAVGRALGSLAFALGHIRIVSVRDHSRNEISDINRVRAVLRCRDAEEFQHSE